jgi:hypothetical protein
MPMRSIVAAMALLALPSTAQAQFLPQAPPAMRLPGIVDRGPPGSVRLPGMIEVRAGIYDRAVAHDLREARETIERRRKNGELSRREARRLRREVRLIARLAGNYGRDETSEPERRELELRAQTLLSRSGAPRVQPAAGRP